MHRPSLSIRMLCASLATVLDAGWDCKLKTQTSLGASRKPPVNAQARHAQQVR